MRGLWHNVGFRNLAYQVLVVGSVIGLAVFMVTNAQDAMEKRGISTGFGFLFEEAGFDIGEGLIAFQSTDSFLRAYGVAVLNTLKGVGAEYRVRNHTRRHPRHCPTLIERPDLETVIGLCRVVPQYAATRADHLLVHGHHAASAAQSKRSTFFDAAFLTNRGLVIPWAGVRPGLLLVADGTCGRLCCPPR